MKNTQAKTVGFDNARLRSNRKAKRTIASPLKNDPVVSEFDKAVESIVEDVVSAEDGSPDSTVENVENSSDAALDVSDNVSDIVEQDGSESVSADVSDIVSDLDNNEDVMQVMDKIAAANETAAAESRNVSNLIGSLDLARLPFSSLLEIAVRCAEAAEHQHREQEARQRAAAERISRLMKTFGVAPNGASTRIGGSEPGKRGRIRPKFVFINPKNPSEAWRGMGMKPVWVREHEAKGGKTEEIRQPYNPEEHDKLFYQD